MKRFFKKLSLLGLLFGSSALLFIFLLTKLYSPSPDNYIGAFFMKQEMLVRKYQQKTPAVVLLGGSNVAFGFNSGMLQDSLGIPVINTGLHAGLGLQFMLRHISQYLTKGDILIIAPEYSHFYGNGAYGNTDLAVLFHIDPSISEDFNIKQFKALIFGTKNLLRDYIFTITETENKILTASGFNEYGDLTSHWNMPSRFSGQISLNDFETANTSFLDYYEKAVADLRNRGIQVIIIPPSFAETSYRNIEDRLIPLFSEFDRRNLSFSIPPQESVYPDSLFFDTYYHLGYEGLTIRTGQLLQLLKSRL
jgi:hypothetical protein